MHGCHDDSSVDGVIGIQHACDVHSVSIFVATIVVVPDAGAQNEAHGGACQAPRPPCCKTALQNCGTMCEVDNASDM